jgi:FHS family Na+ dependent glucose MFS transporter 1
VVKQSPDTTRTKDTRLLSALAYFGSFLGLGLALAALGPTLPGLADQTRVSLSQVSIIFTANSLGYILGSLAGGRLYDRLPSQPLMAGALLLMALALFGIPVFPTLWLMSLLFFILGLGSGVLDVGGNTLVVWLYGREVGPYMNTLHLFFGIGAFLSPLLIDWMVVLSGGIRAAYWLLAVVFLPALIWMVRVPGPTRPQSTDGGTLPFPRQYRGLIFLIAGIFLLEVGAEVAFGGWIFSYAMAFNLGPESVGRVLNALYWGALTLGRLIAVPLATRLLPSVLLLIDMIGAGVSVGVILLFRDWSPALWIGTFGVGLFTASIFASLMNFTERHMPITGQVTGLFLVGANAGAMILPWLIGQTFETQGPQSVMWLIGGAIVVGLLLLIFTLGYARSKSEAPEPTTG